MERLVPERTGTWTNAGKAVNEDLATVTENAAWVLDGATGVTDTNVTSADSDAKWYVERFDAYLRAHVWSAPSLHAVVREGIETVADEYEAIVGDRAIDDAATPSAAIALVRWDDEMIETYVLADCTLLVRFAGGNVERICDTRVTRFDEQVEKEIEWLTTAGGLSVLEAQAKVAPMLVENRTKKNTDDGYWVLSMDPAAAPRGMETQYKRAELTSLSLFSDGFSALMDTYGAFRNWNDLEQYIEVEGVESLFGLLRDIEREDLTCERYSRIKPQDDATVARIAFRFEEYNMT